MKGRVLDCCGAAGDAVSTVHTAHSLHVTNDFNSRCVLLSTTHILRVCVCTAVVGSWKRVASTYHPPNKTYRDTRVVGQCKVGPAHRLCRTIFIVLGRLSTILLYDILLMERACSGEGCAVETISIFIPLI